MGSHRAESFRCLVVGRVVEHLPVAGEHRHYPARDLGAGTGLSGRPQERIAIFARANLWIDTRRVTL
ncbi:hypothetical protein MSEN_09880 [Mycolicibacter senuensis]|uniref:Uncharacterized protein n=1 Tax=Mycolicibacter senuensis TaxID=386913 RepID=A0A7I9XHM4_9MYCO|nr:hypothetical protein MSEN_09880 [Mycolicibacter senuensis]